MNKFGVTLQKHQNSDISATNNSSDLKLTHKVPHIYVHNVPKFQLPIPSGSKVIAKSVFLAPFKTLAHFPFKTIVLCYYWVIRTCHASEKGNIHMKFPFKTFFQDHCTHSEVKPIQNTHLNHFKTLVFSLITAQWQEHSSSSYCLSLTGKPRTSNLHLKSGEANWSWP